MYTDRQRIVGERPIRLFRTAILEEVNRLYEVSAYLPGYTLIGSDTALDGIFKDPDGRIVSIPFVPFDSQYAEVLFADIGALADAFDSQSSPFTARSPELTLLAIHPLALGGSPTDPSNFKDAPYDIHAKSVVFFNKVYIDALEAQRRGEATA
jgi:hypothetical protein